MQYDNYDDKSYLFIIRAQFKYMNFHIFTCILHLLRVYYELAKWPAPSGLIAQSVEHCTSIAEVTGSSLVQARIFSFQALILLLLKLCACIIAMIKHIFILFFTVQMHELPYVHLCSDLTWKLSLGFWKTGP